MTTVVVGGGTYAVLHTPKRQFASNLVKMTKSNDNIANFRVKANGTGKDMGIVSGYADKFSERIWIKRAN